jgi:hypothetical protein
MSSKGEFAGLCTGEKLSGMLIGTRIAAYLEKHEYGWQIKQIVRTIIDFSESDCLIKT